jgi:acetate kinase
MREGRSVDTTMGLTPLDGVPMATRSGSLDPGVVLHLVRELGGDVEAVEAELSRRSGLLGLSGRSGDMRDLLADASDAAHLAIEVFALRVAQAVASMATSAGGLRDLVFSGGIGSHAAPVRAAILAQLAWLGARVDAPANQAHALRIDAPGSRARAWVVTVDEEGEIARAAAAWRADSSTASL